MQVCTNLPGEVDSVSDAARQEVDYTKRMRWLNLILSGLMLLFMIVQYNDPDGLLWMVIYVIPMLWSLCAAWHPLMLLRRFAGYLLMASIGLSALGMFYYWPKSAGWWQKEVWWEVESVREGMGMMVVLIVLLVVFFTRYLMGRRVQSMPVLQK